MPFNLEDELQKQQDLYEDVVSRFETARNDFNNLITSPGSGFNLSDWIDLLPSVSLRTALVTEVADPADYNADNTAPLSVTGPTFITAADAVTLSAGKYDSAYLTTIENEIRTLTADIIIQVLPVAMRDEYFTHGDITVARDARDKIDSVIVAESKRNFPAAPTSIGRKVGDVLGEWQRDRYKNQEEVAAERLKLATDLYFNCIKNGTQIEDIRSRMIMAYSNYYQSHNKTLVGYYDLLVDEKIAEARHALDEIKVVTEQEFANADTIHRDNTEEVELPEETLRRGLQRLELEFDVDDETVKRRFKVMEHIANTYAGWMAAALGSNQTTVTAKQTTAI